MKVIAFGEILWDIIEDKNYLGGAPFNFAAHIVKCGGESSILSAVGNDTLGADAIRQAQLLGVDTSYISILPGYPTGTVDVFLQNGQPDYTIHEGVAFDFIPSIQNIENIEARSFDVFYFGTLAQRNDISNNTLRQILTRLKFRHIFYDINLRKQYFSAEAIKTSLSHCTIFKINDVESKIVSRLLFGKELSFELFAKELLRAFQIEIVIITAGDKGCYILKEGQFTVLPGESVTVIDTVGAGDSFSAAFMSVYDRTADPLVSGKIANKVGAFVASSRGAIPEYSSAIQSLLNSHNEKGNIEH